MDLSLSIKKYTTLLPSYRTQIFFFLEENECPGKLGIRSQFCGEWIIRLVNRPLLSLYPPIYFVYRYQPELRAPIFLAFRFPEH